MTEMRIDKNEMFYLTTKNGVVCSDNNRITVNLKENRQTVKLSGLSVDELVLSKPSTKMTYVLVRMIPIKDFNDQIPIMDKLLQIIAFMTIIIIPLFYYSIRKLVLIPLFRLDKAMHQIENQHLEYRIIAHEHTDEFQHMDRVFNRMADQINQLTIESYEKDIEKLKIEATNLRLQVNPHMLLNSLNMIYSLSQSKNYACIQEFTLSLADYFRYTLHQTEKLVTLRDEIKFVKSFLGIQKIRFPKSFTYIFDISEDILDALLPPFLIQNFVENSIKYALRLGSEIELIIIVKTEGNQLNMSICDTGNGMESDILAQVRKNEPFNDKRGMHIGIYNCRRRLRMYYGNAATLNISSGRDKGTQVWIQIPLQRGAQDEPIAGG
jgi:two-component system, sensor histidine kinase YesM